VIPEQIIEAAFARLDPVALGAALGAVTGLAVFLATAILLLKGGPFIGRNLSLLTYYLYGFRVSWAGALIGLVEGTTFGFALGYVTATLRNWGLAAYASLLRRRALAEARRDLLDKV
jgi:hypothetical protein